MPLLAASARMKSKSKLMLQNMDKILLSHKSNARFSSIGYNFDKGPTWNKLKLNEEQLLNIPKIWLQLLNKVDIVLKNSANEYQD